RTRCKPVQSCLDLRPAAAASRPEVAGYAVRARSLGSTSARTAQNTARACRLHGGGENRRGTPNAAWRGRRPGKSPTEVCRYGCRCRLPLYGSVWLSPDRLRVRPSLHTTGPMLTSASWLFSFHQSKQPPTRLTTCEQLGKSFH